MATMPILGTRRRGPGGRSDSKPRAGDPDRRDGRLHGGRGVFGEAIQPRVEGSYEPGAVLGAVDGALYW